MRLQVELAVVTSADGFTTNGSAPKGSESPRFWASKDDQILFASRKRNFPKIVLGPNTYRESRKYILSDLSDEYSRIVLTRHPQDFRADEVPGKLVFLDLTPKQLVVKLEAEQVEKMLLLSGAKLNGAFFRDGLIDVIHQTIEPVYFFKGLPIAEGFKALPLKMQPGFPLRLNDAGTLYAAYDVIKNK